jgi:EmrB/QacA subfamily drug resistance transporter
MSAAAATASPHTSDQAQAEGHAPARHALLLALCCLAQFMVILDVSIVNVALPTIHKSLGFSKTDLQWVINAYTITFAGFLMLSGRAADLFGQRRTFVTGLLTFSLASLVGGAAQTQEMLVGARALQGLGGAIMAAASLAVITSSFAPGPERHRAIGLWGAMNGAGGATGTLLGGIITEALSWRWILLINLPIGILAALVARAVVAERRGRIDWSSFDLGGALAITGGMLSLVYGIVTAGSEGWGALAALGPIVLGLALLVVFAVIEGRLAPAPLVPLKVFKVRPLRVANAIVLLFSAALFPMWYLTTLYMQEVLHMPPLGAGLAFLPMALTIMACAMRAGALTARYGVRSVLGFGLSTMAIGMALFSVLVRVNGSYGTSVLVPGLLVAVGVGFSVVPSTIAATAGAKPSEAGLASGLVNTSRQMGGALGLAILASIGAQYASHLINADYQAPLLALTNGFRVGYLLGAVFVAAAAIVTFVFVPKLPSRAFVPAQAAASSEDPAPVRETVVIDDARQSTQPVPPLPAVDTIPADVSSPPASPPVPTPGPAPASANGSSHARPAVPPAAASLPLRPASERTKRPVAAVVLAVSGGGRWPLASGSMTIQFATDDAHARWVRR